MFPPDNRTGYELDEVQMRNCLARKDLRDGIVSRGPFLFVRPCHEMTCVISSGRQTPDDAAVFPGSFQRKYLSHNRLHPLTRGNCFRLGPKIAEAIRNPLSGNHLQRQISPKSTPVNVALTPRPDRRKSSAGNELRPTTQRPGVKVAQHGAGKKETIRGHSEFAYFPREHRYANSGRTVKKVHPDEARNLSPPGRPDGEM